MNTNQPLRDESQLLTDAQILGIGRSEVANMHRVDETDWLDFARAVEAEVRSLRSQDDPTDAGIDEAAHELQRVIVECGGDSTECAYDYLRGILAKLPATRAPSVPTTEQFVDCYVCGRKMDGSSEDDCHCFHRKQILAAPATKPLDDPRLQELFGAAISGAMSLGFLNQSPPPEGHWLTQHWNTGRETALAGASFAGSGVGRPLDDAATKP